MALLGSSIDPRLQLQDYSGIVNSAQTQAQGLANIGSQIEAAAAQYKQYKKEQQDTQKRIKAAATVADSIATLVPELQGPLGSAVAQLKDPNISFQDKDAIAQSLSSVLQLGVGVVSGNKELALKREDLGLRRDALIGDITAKQVERDRADRIAAAATIGIMQGLPKPAQDFIKNNFLDMRLPQEGKAYAEQIKEALNRSGDIRLGKWQQGGVTFEGMLERGGNGKWKPIMIDLGLPVDDAAVDNVNAGLNAGPQPDPGAITAGMGQQEAGQANVPTPLVPAGGWTGDLPTIRGVGGAVAPQQDPPISNVVAAAAPVAQTNMSFRTIEKDGKKILVRANPNTGEMIEMTDREGKPIAVSDEKQTKEKYFRDAMSAYDAGNTDEAIIMANAANMGGLFGSTVTINDLERTFGRPPGTKTQAEEPTTAEQTTKPTVGNPKFPLKVIRNGVPATVYDQNQLNQAIEEGFFPAE